LADELLVNRVHLVDVDMRDLVVLREIITGIRAPEARFGLMSPRRRMFSKEIVDEMLDVEWDIGA